MPRKHSRTLIDTCARRAERSFPLEVTSENYILWLEHLLKVSNTIYSEFLAEGLVLTAEKVSEYIVWQEEYIADERRRIVVKEPADA